MLQRDLSRQFFTLSESFSSFKLALKARLAAASMTSNRLLEWWHSSRLAARRPCAYCLTLLAHSLAPLTVDSGSSIIDWLAVHQAWILRHPAWSSMLSRPLNFLVSLWSMKSSFRVDCSRRVTDSRLRNWQSSRCATRWKSGPRWHYYSQLSCTSLHLALVWAHSVPVVDFDDQVRLRLCVS